MTPSEITATTEKVAETFQSYENEPFYKDIVTLAVDLITSNYEFPKPQQ